MSNYCEATLPPSMAFEPIRPKFEMYENNLGRVMCREEAHAMAITRQGVMDDLKKLELEVIESAILEKRDVIHGVAK